MADLLTTITTSQAPWMVLCVFLVIFIIKLQNDKLSQLCNAVSNIGLALVSQDKKTDSMQKDIDAIRQWCESRK